MLKSYKVLFVDDEENILSSLKRGLIEEEYHSYFATSGKEALEIMQNHKIAVIVSDMRMPKMNGLSLLKEVKEKWPHTVRVVLSGYTQLSQILTTINQANVFKFIAKPWKMEEEFIGVIRDALDYYKLIEENQRNKLALENKNRAYQNMLKTMDSKIDDINKRVEVYVECGKRMMKFAMQYQQSCRDSFFRMGETTFDELRGALKGDSKMILSEDLGTLLSQFLSPHENFTRIEEKIDPGISYIVPFELIKFVLLRFKEFFSCNNQEDKLLLKIFMHKKTSVVVQLIVDRFPKIQEPTDEELSLFMLKKEYMNQVFGRILEFFDIDFMTNSKNHVMMMDLTIRPRV